jgi:Ca2+-binding EF-hand superfamily protein
MRNALILAAGIMLAAHAFVAPAAMAQQPEMVIAFLDKTGDGKVDLNEYLTYQQPRLAQFDKDADGELNLAEFRESLQGKAKINANPVFKAANAEGGRTLTQREFLGYHAFIFKTYIDTDKDGFMSTEEWQKIVSAN